MNDKLSKYLQSIAHELRGLEPEQRKAELHEMRGHLEAIVTRLMDGGLSEAEAVEAAIGQFGTARRVGQELKAADTGREPARRQVEAASCAALCYLIPIFLSAPLISAAPAPSLDPWAWLIPCAVFVLAPFVSSLVAGYMAPRSGGRATLWLFGVMGLIRSLTHESHWHWVLYASLLAVTLGMVELGGRVGARRSQKRINLQRA